MGGVLTPPPVAPPDQGDPGYLPGKGSILKTLIPVVGQALHQRDIMNYMMSRREIEKAAVLWEQFAANPSVPYDKQLEAAQNATTLRSTPYNKKPDKTLFDLTPFLHALKEPQSAPGPQGIFKPGATAQSGGAPGAAAAGAPQPTPPPGEAQSQEPSGASSMDGLQTLVQRLNDLKGYNPLRPVYMKAIQEFVAKQSDALGAAYNVEQMYHTLHDTLKLPPDLSAHLARNPQYQPPSVQISGGYVLDPKSGKVLNTLPQTKELGPGQQLKQYMPRPIPPLPGAPSTVGESAAPASEEATTIASVPPKLERTSSGRQGPNGWEELWVNPIDPTQFKWVSAGALPPAAYLPQTISTSSQRAVTIRNPETGQDEVHLVPEQSTSVHARVGVAAPPIPAPPAGAKAAATPKKPAAGAPTAEGLPPGSRKLGIKGMPEATAMAKQQNLGAIDNTLDIAERVQKNADVLNSLIAAKKIEFAIDPEQGTIKAIVNRSVPMTAQEDQLAADFQSLTEHINTLRGPLGATGFRGHEAFGALQAQRGNLLGRPQITKGVLSNTIRALETQRNILANGLKRSGIPVPERSKATEAGPVTVQAPNGRSYHFANQQDADNFKRQAGIK